MKSSNKGPRKVEIATYLVHALRASIVHAEIGTVRNQWKEKIYPLIGWSARILKHADEFK